MRARILLLMPVVMLVSCWRATLIQRTPTTAVYELGGNRHFARESALDQAAEMCGGRSHVMIALEGEEPVGASPGLWPRGAVRIDTEWRVHVECR